MTHQSGMNTIKFIFKTPPYHGAHKLPSDLFQPIVFTSYTTPDIVFDTINIDLFHILSHLPVC